MPVAPILQKVELVAKLVLRVLGRLVAEHPAGASPHVYLASGIVNLLPGCCLQRVRGVG
jgi:hypothetical protein